MDKLVIARRSVITGFGALMLSACSPPPIIRMVEDGFKAPSINPAQYPLDAAQIEKIPYASLGVRVGNQPAAIMIMSSEDGAVTRWVSANHAVFEIEHGHLIMTRGLPRDITSTEWLLPDPLGSNQPYAKEFRVYRRISLRQKDNFEKGVAVASLFVDEGDETIHILGQPYRTRRVCEHMRMPTWRWGKENWFWIDVESGLVRRSIQRFCPEVAPIQLEILKAPKA